jgi:hypothetical protein
MRELVLVVEVVMGLDSRTASAANLGCWMRMTSAAAAFSAIPTPQVAAARRRTGVKNGCGAARDVVQTHGQLQRAEGPFSLVVT